MQVGVARGDIWNAAGPRIDHGAARERVDETPCNCGIVTTGQDFAGAVEPVFNGPPTICSASTSVEVRNSSGSSVGLRWRKIIWSANYRTSRRSVNSARSWTASSPRLRGHSTHPGAPLGLAPTA